MSDIIISERGTRVLIETLWNVKMEQYLLSRMEKGCINRNIVECKGEKYTIISPSQYGINRNIVECKVV